MARIRRIDVNLTIGENVSSKSIPFCWVYLSLQDELYIFLMDPSAFRLILRTHLFSIALWLGGRSTSSHT